MQILFKEELLQKLNWKISLVPIWILTALTVEDIVIFLKSSFIVAPGKDKTALLSVLKYLTKESPIIRWLDCWQILFTMGGDGWISVWWRRGEARSQSKEGFDEGGSDGKLNDEWNKKQNKKSIKLG